MRRERGHGPPSFAKMPVWRADTAEGLSALIGSFLVFCSGFLADFIGVWRRLFFPTRQRSVGGATHKFILVFDDTGESYSWFLKIFP